MAKVYQHLSMDIAKRIRKLKRDGLSNAILAERFGMSANHVGKIVRDKIWREEK